MNVFVGLATAKKIINLRQKAFVKEQPPLSPDSLGALPGSRLNQNCWQGLLDDGTITLQVPEQIPDEGPEPDTEAALKQMMLDEAKTLTVGQMVNYGLTIIETVNYQIKTHLKEWSMTISNDTFMPILRPRHSIGQTDIRSALKNWMTELFPTKF